jgi:ribonuclease P protein subunit POP4
LWKEYIEEVLGGNYTDNSIKNKMLKADMHGASISVWKSSCKSYEGQKGIVIMETMNTFRVITAENSLKSNKNLVFLKENSIFLLEVAGKIVKLFGENFMYRPSLRSRVRWKQKDKLRMFK